MAECWYVDSSVVLRVVREGSPAARAWFDGALAAGDSLVASRLMAVEVVRVLRNNGLSLTTALDVIGRFVLTSLDDALADEAMAIKARLGGADSLHVASALRLGVGHVVIVTHDAQMAQGASALGLAVIDPVTDDPYHACVVPGSATGVDAGQARR